MTKRVMTAVFCCIFAAFTALALTGCSMLNTSTYTPESKAPVVSSPTIGQDGVLRVGVNTTNPPLAGVVSSKIVGLDVDIAAALADSLGLKLSLVDVGSDPETALANGTVDIVMGIDKSSSNSTFWKSEPYLSTGVALFSMTSSAALPTSASGATFAAQVSSRSAWAVMNEYGEETLTSTTNLSEAFRALSTGAVQYVAADAVIGIYAAHGDNLEVYSVALMQQPSGYCIGVSDANSDLKTLISDSVVTLTSNGLVSVIETKWLGTPLDVKTLPLTEGAMAAATLTENNEATTAG